MSTPCPHCAQDLGDLDPVMNQLAGNKISGTVMFKCKHCQQEIKAFANVGMYYIATSGAPVLIGAA